MSSRWHEVADDDHVAAYDTQVAERLAQAAAEGRGSHAEADLVVSLVPAGSLVLDGGCGTGRVAWELAGRGLRVVGVDSDTRMLQRATRADAVADADAAADAPRFVRADLAGYTGGPFDLVLLAGNVLPLLAGGALDATVHALVRCLRPGGLLVAGYGLDAEHLPQGCPVTPVDHVDAAYRAAGMDLRARWGTWEGAAFTGDYAVDVLVRRDAGPA